MADEPIESPTRGVELAPGLLVPEQSLRWRFVRSRGPGGQNVNKVSTAAELRVCLADLPLSARAQERFRRLAGSRLTAADELQLVADNRRTQEGNRAEALGRLRELLRQALIEPKVRRKTKPSRAARQRRIDGKKRRGQIKSGRGRVNAE